MTLLLIYLSTVIVCYATLFFTIRSDARNGRRVGSIQDLLVVIIWCLVPIVNVIGLIGYFVIVFIECNRNLLNQDATTLFKQKDKQK